MAKNFHFEGLSTAREVISQYAPLHKEGKYFFGQCPFCGDMSRGETLCFDERTGFFFCPRCGAGGNVPKFLSLMENIPYSEACEKLKTSINYEP